MLGGAPQRTALYMVAMPAPRVRWHPPRPAYPASRVPSDLLRARYVQANLRTQRCCRSTGRKHMAIPYSPGGWRLKPNCRAFRAQKTREESGSGSRRRRPFPNRSRKRRDAPGSRISRPLSTISCEAWPLMFTTKPMPHASCSFAGSYKPCGVGSWLAVSTEYTAHSPLRTRRKKSSVYRSLNYSSN